MIPPSFKNHIQDRKPFPSSTAFSLEDGALQLRQKRFPKPVAPGRNGRNDLRRLDALPELGGILEVELRMAPSPPSPRAPFVAHRLVASKLDLFRRCEMRP